MSFITFNRAPPNLCCKHVPTDSLKELIAPNNLTIWLLRSIPTRLLALQRLGPIQMAESERGSKGLPGGWKEKRMTKTTICSLSFLLATPDASKTLNLYDPNGRPPTGMLLREDGEHEKGSKWERRKTTQEIPEPSTARGFHLTHHIYFSFFSAVAFRDTNTKCKWSFDKNRKQEKVFCTLLLLAFSAVIYTKQKIFGLSCIIFYHKLKQPDWIYFNSRNDSCSAFVKNKTWVRLDILL